MNTYKKHSAHQNTSNSIAKKGLFVEFKKEKNSNSKAHGFVVFPQRKTAKKNPMKLASGGRVMSRGDKTTMNASTNKSLEEKVKVAKKIADEMIKVACQYAEKWGRTSSVGFITMYGQIGVDSVLEAKGLKDHLVNQKDILIDTIENDGVVPRGIIKGKYFNLSESDFENTIIKIFIHLMSRLGIAIENEKKRKILEQVFCGTRNGAFVKTEENGGISSNIACRACLRFKNIKPAYTYGLDGWKKMFKVLDNAVSSAELKNEEFSRPVDDKEENADDDISVSVSQYTPQETKLKKEIEDSAIKIASEFYEEKGFSVKSVEKENCGWDLTVVKGNKVRHIEVKGTSRNEFHFFLSKNEYNQMKKDSNWRLFVVKNVLENPDPDFVVKRPENVEKLFDLNPFCFEGTWKMSSNC